MSLNGVLDIALAVPEPEPLVAFWMRRGLVHDGDGGLGTPERPIQLRVRDGSYRHLSGLHLSCDAERDLEEIRARLSDQGIDAVLADSTLRCVAPDGDLEVTVDVATPAPLVPAAARVVNGPGSVLRRDVRAEAVDETSPRPPRRVGHVVLGTRDVAGAAAFFVGGLGFRISDQVQGGAAVFARCSADHHNLLLMPAKVPYLNHYALEMDDFDAVGKAGQATVAEAPESSIVGIGRHTVGGNIFWYLLDPAGNTFELFADMDQILDETEWDARRRNDHWDATFATWGPQPPRKFFAPADLADIAAGRTEAGL
jgi:catechol 2,3-dioxygenase-like lactoylglutathione lyase family enzyme